MRAAHRADVGTTEGRRTLATARSYEGDEALLRLVRTALGYDATETLRWFEERAEYGPVLLWQALDVGVRGEDYYVPADHWREHLANDPSMDTLRRLEAFKRAYTQDFLRGRRRIADGTPMCALFACQRPASETFNRLPWCDRHRGLALIHMLRHRCRSCRIFGLMALREAMPDPGHTLFYLRQMTVPLRNSWRNGNRYNVSLRHFCAPEFDSRRHRAWYYGPDSNIADMAYRYWDERSQRSEDVPLRSWVWVDKHTTHWGEYVAAWVQAELEWGGEWSPVDDRPTLLEILAAADWHVLENGGWIQPCPTKRPRA